MKLSELNDKKALIIASSGGHLLEAIHISRKFNLSDQSIYISHENPQSYSLLRHKPHYFVNNVRSRDWMGAIKIVPLLLKIAKNEDFEVIISTGAAIAISATPIKFIFRKPYLYFESITRIRKPSMAGKILEFFPFIHRYSEHGKNFGKKWKVSPSILEDFCVKSAERKTKPLQILVTLGTISNYRFDRLVDTLLRIIDSGDIVYWQLGCTTREGLPGVTCQTIANEEMIEIAKKCDVVVSHGGIGTILDLISLGIRPIVLPRQSALNEHIDNHQNEAAVIFEGLDLVQILSDNPKREELVSATSKKIDPGVLSQEY